MIKNLFFILLCANVFTSLQSCHETQVKPLNPNGDTELALLMREMYVEAEQIKKVMEEGKTIKLALNHHEILTAESTMPEKAASQEYKSFAKIYLDAIDNLKSNPDEPERSYKNLVASCTACHQSLCPGPLVKINNLK